MDRPTLSATTAMRQAGMTADTYLSAAVKMLDQEFGTGYAKENPIVLAECIRCQASDFNNTIQVCALFDIAEAIGKAFTGISMQGGVG